MSYKRLVCIVLLFISALIVAIGANCHRCGYRQFSPYTFQERSVTTIHLPYLEWELWSWSDEPYYTPLVRYWIDAGYFAPKGAAAQWDTISGFAPSESFRGSAAHFWQTQRLRMSFDELILWSLANEKQAAALWPRIIELIGKNCGVTTEQYYSDALDLLIQIVSEDG